MQFSVGVEYALHSLFYMVAIPQGKTVGIKELADLNSLTESYLSKIFTKLRKGGIVRSVTGVKGGYELAKSPEDISFWDIIEAIEGSSHMFQCAEIRQQNKFSKGFEFKKECPCLIKVVIHEAEELMRNNLRGKSLQWLYDEVYCDFDEDRRSSITEWAMDRA